MGLFDSAEKIAKKQQEKLQQDCNIAAQNLSSQGINLGNISDEALKNILVWTQRLQNHSKDGDIQYYPSSNAECLKEIKNRKQVDNIILTYLLKQNYEMSQKLTQLNQNNTDLLKVLSEIKDCLDESNIEKPTTNISDNINNKDINKINVDCTEDEEEDER